MVVVVIGVPGVVVIVVGRFEQPLFPRRGRRKPETHRTDAAAVAFFERNPAGLNGQYRGRIGKNPLPQMRERIEHGGDEHVAGDSADRIEVDGLHAAAARWTGTT